MGGDTDDVDEVTAELRARVAARRAAGEYPEGLEDDLDAHFRRLVARGEGTAFHDLHAALDAVTAAADLGTHRISGTSDVPGGELAHRAVAKAVNRQIDGVLGQVVEHARAVEEALRLLVVHVEHPSSHVHSELLGELDVLNDRLAALERTTLRMPDPAPLPGRPVGIAASRPSTVDAVLEQRLASLEEAEARRHIDPWWGNEAFEEAFRGSRAELLDRYRDLAAVFDGCAPVLDVGCGRGELLELLAESGTEAYGVEIDPALVELGRAGGLDVRPGDGLDHLAALPDSSLGGLAMVQVIEHLDPQPAVDVVRTAAAKVRPGGKVVVETVNPQSLYVYAYAFWLDPTHGRPVHPAFLSFLFRQAGFAEVAVEWRSPPPPAALLEELATGDEAADEIHRANVGRLNQLLFGPQDYAIVATR